MFLTYLGRTSKMCHIEYNPTFEHIVEYLLTNWIIKMTCIKCQNHQMSKAMKPGLSVIRGSDWPLNDVRDGNAPGKIIRQSSMPGEENTWEVEWLSTGQICFHPMGDVKSGPFAGTHSYKLKIVDFPPIECQCNPIYEDISDEEPQSNFEGSNYVGDDQEVNDDVDVEELRQILDFGQDNYSVGHLASGFMANSQQPQQIASNQQPDVDGQGSQAWQNDVAEDSHSPTITEYRPSESSFEKLQRMDYPDQDWIDMNVDSIVRSRILEILSKHVSVENAFDVLVCGYLANEMALFAATAEFICQNKEKVMKTSAWELLKKDNSKMSSDIAFKLLKFNPR